MHTAALYIPRILQYTGCKRREEVVAMSDKKIIIDVVVDVQKDFITGALAKQAFRSSL